MLNKTCQSKTNASYWAEEVNEVRREVTRNRFGVEFFLKPFIAAFVNLATPNERGNRFGIETS